MIINVLGVLALLWGLWFSSLSLWAPRYPDRVPAWVKRFRRKVYCRRNQHAVWVRDDDGSQTLRTCWACAHLAPPPPPTWRPGTARPVKQMVYGWVSAGPLAKVRFAVIPKDDGTTADVWIDRDVDFGVCPDATHIGYANDAGADLFYVEIIRELRILPLTLGGHA